MAYYHIRNRKHLNTEARKLRIKIQQYMKDNYGEFERAEETLRVEVLVYERFYNLDGSVKKKDIDNRLKFFMDSIFDEMGINDMHVFEINIKKVDYDIEQTEIIIHGIQESKKRLSDKPDLS